MSNSADLLNVRTERRVEKEKEIEGEEGRREWKREGKMKEGNIWSVK